MKNFEVEQKYRIAHPESIRKILRRLGAKLILKGHEKNELWDFKSLVRSKGSVLRLRETGPKGLLTFKGPRLKSRYKKRLEVESPVKAEAVRVLLKTLGFKITARYEKYREEYCLGKAHITIDRLAKLGWFVEIEASPKAIGQLSKKLGFSKKDQEERSYLEMIYGNRSLWAGK